MLIIFDFSRIECDLDEHYVTALTHVTGVQLHCGHFFQRDVSGVSAVTAVKTAGKQTSHDDNKNTHVLPLSGVFVGNLSVSYKKIK